MKNLDSFRTLLVFPPVWTPVTPYLALPLLAAYLRREGYEASVYDASMEFFLDHLLIPETLTELFQRILPRIRRGDYAAATEEDQTLLGQMQKDPTSWTDKITGVQASLDHMRGEASFYEPEVLMRAQNHVYDLLRMASLAYFPTALTFNTFSNPTITDLSRMISFCDDRDLNPFLGFYSARLPAVMQTQAPSLVGLSVSTSHQLVGALTLVRFLKKTHPSVHVTLGGRHILRLQDAFKAEPHLFQEFGHSLVLGNGEKPLIKLVQQLSSGGSLSEVPNLVYFNNGRLIFNERAFHDPISRLPTADFSDLPLRRYLAPTPIMPIRLSEGCYWGKCTFCSRYDNKSFQTIPPEKAAEQMEEIQKRYDVSCFTVNDDCLTPPYLEALSQAIIKKGLELQISLWCKPVSSFTRDRLRLLSKAGVRLIRWGLETGNGRILKLMNKGTRLGDTLKVLKSSAEAGIWNHATIILGFPTETEEEALETIDFLDRYQNIIHSSILFRFVLLGHSYIHEHPDEFGITSVSEKGDIFSYDHPFVCPTGMDAERLSSFLKWAQQYRLEEMYGHPYWFYLRIREYLLLYASKYTPQRVLRWKVSANDLSLHRPGEEVHYVFKKPEEITPDILEKIYRLIRAGGEVGLSWTRKNLLGACLIGYAVERGRIIGTMTLKRPLEHYVRQIEAKTHVDLNGFLERGYRSVRPEYQGLHVGDHLLKGLVGNVPGQKLYVTIRLDNIPAIRLTNRNNMRLAATYTNEKTGHEIGLFTND
jgi:anaerobic magnesium-protoporphyrin IX monomethyl ester cyclase